MHWLYQALCCLLLLVTSDATLTQESPASLLDLQFALEPIELQLGEDLRTAKEHYIHGEWLKAIEQLTTLLEANPNHERATDCHFLIAESLVQLQQYERASVEFRRLLELKPNAAQTAQAEFRLAEAAMLLGQDDAAAGLLQQFRTRHPQHDLNAYALPYLAQLAGSNDNAKRAHSLYSLALQQYPNGPLARECSFQIAMLQYEAGEFLAAKSKLSKLIETDERRDAESWKAFYWLAMTEFQLGKHEHAAERFAQLIKSSPDHRLADASLFFKGEAQRKLGRPREAQQAYQLLRQSRPQSEYFSRSIVGELKCLRPTRNADQALDLYRELQQLDDDSSAKNGTNLVAEVLLSAERFEEARRLLRPFVESRQRLEEPEAREHHYTNLYLYALALRGLGKSSRASEMLGRVRVDLASADIAERVLLARVEIFNEQGDFGSAIKTGRDAESRFPEGRLLDAIRAQLVRAFIMADRLNDAKATFLQMQQQQTSQRELVRAARWLGEATYAANDLVNARRVFETLLRWQQDESDHAQAASGLAWIDVKEANHQSAAARFEQFLDLFPGHESVPEVRIVLSQSLSELGRDERAVEVLTFFEQLNREHPSRAEGLYRLALLLEADPDAQKRAEQVAERLVRDHPKYRRRDAALYLLGMLQRKQNSPVARTRSRQIVKEHYTSQYWSDALYRSAELAADENDLKLAKRYLTKLISSERDRRVIPHALYLRGQLQSEERSWPGARETLRELIHDYPQSPLVGVARYGVAESFFQEKQFDHAQRLFDILDREQQFPAGEAWDAMVRLRRAQLLVKQEGFLEAVNVATSISKDFPDFSQQHEVDYVLGRANAARGEFTEARQHYSRVVVADPEYQREISAMAQWMIGETHFHQKNFGQAIQSYKRVATDTTFTRWRAASFLQAGKCYEKLEDLELAKRRVYPCGERFQ